MTSRRPCRRPAPASRGQRGIAIVELALVLLPLVLLLSLTADLGRAFYTFNTLTKAARGAARYLALVDSSNAARRTEALNLVLYGNTDGTGTPLVADLSTSKVQICAPSLAACAADHANVSINGGLATMNLVSVRISGYAYAPLFSAVLPASLGFKDILVTMRAFP
jgi:Flp pilus assembly protein TadG